MEIIGTYRNLVNLFGFQGFCLKIYHFLLFAKDFKKKKISLYLFFSIAFCSSFLLYPTARTTTTTIITTITTQSRQTLS